MDRGNGGTHVYRLRLSERAYRQSDGTAWMGFYCLVMLKIALELAQEDPVYQDLATKFYEHFWGIARAMTLCGGQERSLWDQADGFFYDALHMPDGSLLPLKVRSLWYNALRTMGDLARGLDEISEIYDGDAPYTPRGCVAQAWSVAELLRAWQETTVEERVHE